MSDELSGLVLDVDFEEVLTTEDATRWVLERSGPLEVRAGISPQSLPNDRFQARLAWKSYPDEPPSLKFRNPVDGRIDDPTAWPQADGFRPNNLDACVNWCAEGFAHHPEWRNDRNLRWDAHGNVLLKVLRYLQDTLDNSYQGRFGR
jgi:hypothetical protein